MSEIPSEAVEMAPPVPLSLAEQRILGVLIEKQKTTPDAYPMTINAMVTGSNQKSNRDPILNLTAEQVESTLEGLNSRGLVVRVVSGRVDKWKHVLYEHWRLDKIELAVIADLFLRGPQSEGELRSHVSRMEEIPDLEALRAILRRLAERKFVVYLTPEGRRGTTVTHGCQDEASLNHHRSSLTEAARLADLSAPAVFSPTSHAAPPGSRESSAELEDLRKQLADLRLLVEQLTQRVSDLNRGIGPAAMIKE
ncbi:MAG: DUF480 domain-containing protein [Gemmataceae bacterium]